MKLKTMNVGELMDNTIALYRAQFKSYMATVLLGILMQVVCLVIPIVFVFLFFAKEIGGMILEPEIIAHSPSAAARFLGFIGVMIISCIPVILAGIALYGGLIKKASEQIAGRKFSATEAFAAGWRKCVWMVLSGLIVSMIAGVIGIPFLWFMSRLGDAMFALGVIVLLLVGTYWMVRIALASQWIVIENKGPWEALGKSMSLVNHSWWRCFGYIVLIGMMTAAFSNILAWIVGFPVGGLIAVATGVDADSAQMLTIMNGVTDLLKMLLSSLILPVSVIAYTLLFYDLRVRKEGLDLQVMVNDLTDNNDPMRSNNNNGYQ